MKPEKFISVRGALFRFGGRVRGPVFPIEEPARHRQGRPLDLPLRSTQAAPPLPRSGWSVDRDQLQGRAVTAPDLHRGGPDAG